MPGSLEPSETPPRRTLSSPSRPASQKARDSVCMTASSGSGRKFFKRRKSRLASPSLASEAPRYGSLMEPSRTEAGPERGFRGSAEVGPCPGDRGRALSPRMRMEVGPALLRTGTRLLVLSLHKHFTLFASSVFRFSQECFFSLYYL